MGNSSTREDGEANAQAFGPHEHWNFPTASFIFINFNEMLSSKIDAHLMYLLIV